MYCRPKGNLSYVSKLPKGIVLICRLRLLTCGGKVRSAIMWRS